MRARFLNGYTFNFKHIVNVTNGCKVRLLVLGQNKFDVEGVSNGDSVPTRASVKGNDNIHLYLIDETLRDKGDDSYALI